MSITNHRLGAAEWKPTKHVRGVIDPTLVVVHGTASSLSKYSAVKYCQNNSRKVAYHIIIERDGTIVQLAPFNRRVNHAGRSTWNGREWCNGYSIAIGLVDPGHLKGTRQKAKAWYGEWFDEGDGLVAKNTPQHGKGHVWLPYTPEQHAALDVVVTEIEAVYPGIDIQGHWAVSPGRKIDPNPLVDLQSIGFSGLSDVGESASETIANQELSHSGDASVCEPAGVILARQSREYKSTNLLKGGAATAVVSGSVFEAASLSNLQGAKTYLDVVTGFTSAYGVFVLIASGVVGWAVCEYIQYCKRESYDSGAYEPSGADEGAE